MINACRLIESSQSLAVVAGKSHASMRIDDRSLPARIARRASSLTDPGEGLECANSCCSVGRPSRSRRDRLCAGALDRLVIIAALIAIYDSSCHLRSTPMRSYTNGCEGRPRVGIAPCTPRPAGTVSRRRSRMCNSRSRQHQGPSNSSLGDATDHGEKRRRESFKTGVLPL
jgi:hypothetical protein